MSLIVLRGVLFSANDIIYCAELFDPNFYRLTNYGSSCSSSTHGCRSVRNNVWTNKTRGNPPTNGWANVLGPTLVAGAGLGVLRGAPHPSRQKVFKEEAATPWWASQFSVCWSSSSHQPSSFCDFLHAHAHLLKQVLVLHPYTPFVSARLFFANWKFPAKGVVKHHKKPHLSLDVQSLFR